MQLEFGGQRYDVAAGELFIGSDPTAAISLAGDGVAARHARVRKTASGALVVEQFAPGAQIRVNGTSIGADPTPVFHGDHLGIGTHDLVVVDPGRQGATQVFRPAANDLSTPSRSVDLGGRLVSLNDGREYPIAVVPFVLGRDASAEVVVASPDASRRHAEIVVRPDGAAFVDLSVNGSYINNIRVPGRQELKALDVIRIGAEEFRFYPAPRVEEAPGRPPEGAAFRLNDTLIGLPKTASPIPAVARPLATLLVKSGSLKGERIPVRTAVVNIGRAEYNDLRFPDPSISSSHVKLQLREGVWTLSDLGSTNGTVVDGERVDDEVPLSPGALVKLGDVSMSFEPQDERAARTDRTALLERASLPAPVVAEPSSTPPPAALRQSSKPAPPPPAAPVGSSGTNRSQVFMGLAIVAMIGVLVALYLA